MDRLDKYLVNKGLVKTRSKAIYLIKNNNILVNNIIINKPSKLVNDNDNIIIKNNFNYVSKGALKLLKAIDYFNINLNNKIMLDIGSSTGGFTDVALKNNIKKVYAVDIGSNQFDNNLKKDKRVILNENTDIRKYIVKDNIDMVTIDISFISVTKIIDKIKEINPKEIIVLIKPQFECGKEIDDKYKGIPLNKEVHRNCIKKIIDSFESINYNINNLTYSPIRGGSGNIEYLAYFTKDNKKEIDIDKVINEAFKVL